MTKLQAKKRIEILRKEIRRHAYLYHVADKPEISDAAWDSLKRELALLEQEFSEFITQDSPTQRVSGKPLKQFKKIRHRVRQWSLNDAFSQEEIRAWEERNLKILQKHNQALNVSDLDYVCELKIDGLHIVLTYVGGALKAAATRGDGMVGEDVTLNVKTIGSIPLTLRKKVDVVAEGEIWMSKQSFDMLNREQKISGQTEFANPRNAAAGSIRQLNSRVTASRSLDSFVYDVVFSTEKVPQTQQSELEYLKELGFKAEKHYAYCKDITAIYDFLKQWENRHEHLDYLIDGVVIKINKKEHQELLGYTGKAPRFALAFKFSPEEATTVIEDIDAQVGRLGRLTPVARLRPVRVAGSMVSRATLHNQSFIDELDIRVGDTVIIRKAGDIIPEVVRVLKRMRQKSAKPFVMPKSCLICKRKVFVDTSGGSIVHFCPHPDCGARQERQIMHFISKRACNIEGMGEKLVRRFLDEGLISDEGDIFTLRQEDVQNLERFGEKSAGNVIRAIGKARRVTLQRFLYGLGIKHIGERTAAQLARCIEERYGKVTIEKLSALFVGKTAVTAEVLEEIPDFGPRAAESVVFWFADSENKKLLRKLSKAVVITYEGLLQGILEGKLFVFTGTLATLTRDQAKDLVLEKGGIVGGAISKGTDYAVIGTDPGGKFKKAQELGVRIIDEQKFLKLVRE